MNMSYIKNYRKGTVLENEFWTPPPPINFVHNLDFIYFQLLVYI